jgi:hypothetical protein
VLLDDGEQLRGGPLGFLAPVSHFLIVLSLVDSGRPGDSRVTLAYLVKAQGGREHIFSYKPAGTGHLLLPEVESAACDH